MPQPRRKYTLTATIYDKRGRVLSREQNSYRKTHPLQSAFSKKYGNGHQIFLHAEIHALIKLKDWSKAYKIKVERYNKDGTPALAKPCKVCSEALQGAGIEIVEHP